MAAMTSMGAAVDKLSFPTQAEQALAAFNSATKTISLITICNKMGGVRADKYKPRGGLRFGTRVIEYTFDDDSSLEITGQGKSHKVETFLP